MNHNDMLRDYVMNAAMMEELPFDKPDILPIEFYAQTDLVTGQYYDIQYVIFERPSTRAIWKCSTLDANHYKIEILQVNAEYDEIAGYIE